MRRVSTLLEQLGACVETTDGHAPMTIHGRALRGAAVTLPVASAQLKSAVLLAGMQAAGRTTVTEPEPTRDHTENMLRAMGVPLTVNGNTVAIDGPVVPRAIDVAVPGDPSSAAFLLAAAVLVPGSEVIVEEVCLNPTRIGFLHVLQRMGADVEMTEDRIEGGESVGTIVARSSSLRPFRIGASEVPACIDELPLLCTLAAFADGVSELTGAEELRVKESDRIATTAAIVRAIGAGAEELADGLRIAGLPSGARGVSGAKGAEAVAAVATGGDHRIAMAAAVGALGAGCTLSLDDADAVAVSFPEFFASLERLGA
jgi:3-phosphoshikimate 1-carboxyvinyltransferase